MSERARQPVVRAGRAHRGAGALCLFATCALGSSGASPTAFAQAAPAGIATVDDGAASDPGGAPLFVEADAVSTALRHNTTLRTALLQLSRARMSERSLEHRDDLLFTADAGFTHSENPILVSDGVLTSLSDNAQAGVGLRKHLPWGTDLSLRLGSSVQHSNTDAIFAGATGMSRSLGPGYGLSARLTLAQPLMRGFGREVNDAALAGARADRTSAERARDRVASEQLRDVLTAYWNLWVADAALRIQEQSYELARRQRDQALARVRTGSLAGAASLAFETRLAVRAEDVLAARTELDRRRAELRQRLGLSARERIAERLQDDPPLPQPPPPDAQERALSASTPVREREAAIAAAELQARTAADPLRPRLDLEAYVQADGLGNQDVGAAAERLGTLGAVSAHVGVTYEMPFTGVRRQSEAARAALAVEVARSQLQELQQSLSAQVETALSQLSAGRERLLLAQQTEAIASNQLTAEQARLSAGASTELQVAQAEDDLRAARLRITRAKADLRVTAIGLQYLTGSLLTQYADELGETLH